MPVLKNPRHERFALLLARLHGEMTVTDAHEQAGYRRNDGNASTLSQHPDVQARVKELKGRTAAKMDITREKLIEWHNEIREQGKKNNQLSPAETAIKEISVLTGHRVERSEVGAPGDFDHLNDDDLERLLVERLADLGLSVETLPESDTQH